MNEQEILLQQALVLVTWPLIFVIHFIISSFASADNSSKYLSSNNFYTLPTPLNRLQKGKYIPNTSLIQKQPFFTYSGKQVFLKTLQNSQKNTVAGVYF